MSKPHIAALASAVAVLATVFGPASALLGMLGTVGIFYLAIYGAIMLGYGLSNSFMMLAKNKTLNENVAAGGDYGRTNANALFAGFACVGVMGLLIAAKLVVIALFLGLLLLGVLTLGLQAKRFRDGKFNDSNIR